MAIIPEEVKGVLPNRKERAGEARIVVKRVAIGIYASGGVDKVVDELSEVVAGFVVADGGYLAEIVWANSDKNKLRIKVYTGPGSEVLNGTDLSAVNVTITALGF